VLAAGCAGGPGTERSIYLWDLAGGNELRPLAAAAKQGDPWELSPFSAPAFAPDGKTLFAGGSGSAVIAWDPTTGAELRHVGRGLTYPHALAVSPDGRTLAVSVGTALRLIDAKSGKDRFPEFAQQLGVNHTAVTPDGRVVVTGEAHRILLWDPATGRELRRVDLERGWFVAVRLLDGGRTLLTAEIEDKGRAATLRLSDLSTGKELRRFNWPGKPGTLANLLAVTPGGKMAAVCCQDGTVVLMDLDTGKVIRRLKKDTADAFFLVYGGAFTPDGRMLVLWDSDSVVRSYDVASGRVVRQIPFIDEEDSGPRPIGGRRLLSTGAVSPDGRHLALAGYNRFIVLHDLATGRLVWKLEDLGDGVGSLAFSPDGRCLAWGGASGPAVHLVEVATARQRYCLVGHRGGVLSLAFSADGRMLVSGGWDTTAVVWDLTGRLLARRPVSQP
jgi:WD40 repeat protein